MGKPCPSQQIVWMSGTPYAEKIGDAENNCLRGSERVFVKDVGLTPIQELNGWVEVLSDGGLYRKAFFKSYGTQELMKIRFKDGQEVHATPKHQWIVLSGNSGRRKHERINTEDLKAGDKIPVIRATVPESSDLEGVAHGFTFGDGTLTPQGYCRVNYYKKDEELFKLLGQFGNVSSSKIPTVSTLPFNFKKIPNIGEHSNEYLLGFLMGYIAADGHVRGTNTRLHCKDKVTLEGIRDIAQHLGLKVNPVILERNESPFTGELSPLYSISFSAETFPGHLLAREDQRNKWKPAKRVTKVPYKEIESVDYTGLIEEVYCCNEPETHSFVIEGNLLTGNCWFVSMRPQKYGNSKIKPVIGSKDEALPSMASVFTFDQAMKGGGVGVNVQCKNTNQMPKVKNKVEIEFNCNHQHPDFESELKDEGVLAFTPKPVWEIYGFKRHVIKDSREGWSEALQLAIDAHFIGEHKKFVFDISKIRPRGSEIKGFGGVASGPTPLVQMLKKVNEIINKRVGEKVTSVEWGDVIQNIGKCVIAGNVRRTALILIGDKEDKDFIESKNYSLEKNQEASQWRWASNNSVAIDETTTAVELEEMAKNIYYNGEPGVTNIELAKHHGRIADGYQKGIDGEVEGYNP